MRFKVTTYVQVAQTMPNEHPEAAVKRIWQAMDAAMTNTLIGENLCEDCVVTIPERLTDDEDTRFPFGLGKRELDAEAIAATGHTTPRRA